MPNRILKESIRTSPNFNACRVEARDLFIRLITAADDYGRFEADGNVLRAACYPRLLDQVSTSQVEQWRDELADPDLPDGPCIRLYEAKGRLYGYCPTWFDHQRPARSKSKHPAPPRKALPLDVVESPPSDHNALPIVANPPQSAAPYVSRESLVVNREARSDTPPTPPVGGRRRRDRSALQMAQDSATTALDDASARLVQAACERFEWRLTKSKLADEWRLAGELLEVWDEATILRALGVRRKLSSMRWLAEFIPQMLAHEEPPPRERPAILAEPDGTVVPMPPEIAEQMRRVMAGKGMP